MGRLEAKGEFDEVIVWGHESNPRTLVLILT